MTSQKAEMTLRQMNLNMFAGEPIPHVFFQPRFEPWYDWQKRFEHLPQQFKGKNVRHVNDALGASMRCVHYYTGKPDPIVRSYDPTCFSCRPTRGMN